jgi:2-polyprenyl-6-methoxyphenol hydroxylase-like FAD-dependent oxidoreductase
MEEQKLKTSCCIAGGGPAGMMAGFLLARAGVDVIVLEKHADFFRDFRGDTIHPSTFELMSELGFLDEFLEITHQEVPEIGVMFDEQFLKIADFKKLATPVPAIGMMPQWDFLNFIQKKAQAYPTFHLMMEANATELLKENEKIIGLKTATKGGSVEIYATLVIAADGRSSVLRERAGLKINSYGSPIDVLWFRLSKQPTDPAQSFGYSRHGSLVVLLDRRDYWQCGFVIAKGGFEETRKKDIQAFGKTISEAVPFFKDRVGELKDWEQVKLLTVIVDHLEKWYRDGFLCIGDAAHAMSPVGGVGINLAIQDAVATANFTWRSLKEKQQIDVSILRKIQKRREFPTRMTQRLQMGVQNGIIKKRLSGKKQQPPLLMKMFNRFQWLRKIPAKAIGIGIRPEHIQTPDIAAAST